MPEVVIYSRSASVVVDDVATFVDLEHGLEFTVDYYFHGLFQCGCKVHLDAEITISCQMETVLTLYYSSSEVSGTFHTLDGVVCIWPLSFLNGHVTVHSTHSPSNSLPSVVVESAELFDRNTQN